MLYNVLLVSAVKQSGSAICVHIPPPPGTALPPASRPTKSSQSPELSSMCYTAVSYELSVSYMEVYICQSHFPNSSHPAALPQLGIHSEKTVIQKAHVPCSLQHYLQQPRRKRNLNVLRQMNDQRRRGTYIRWDVAQPQKGTKLGHL